ncbi:hypothetical protein [Caballeronia sp. DA-9]|uniref:hypothetical protein n=1 Tax=Caballeronia sp. DA-9 TaxID=3436237 RepID=UPI003F67D51A
MSLTVSIIAKLSGVDTHKARRALDTVAAFDEPGAVPPAEFTVGAAARCYALATIADHRPGLFWAGVAAMIAVPVLLLIQVFHHG